MKCIIGLGNIGKKYDKTRHNAGIMALDFIAKKYGIAFNKKRKKSIYAEGYINEQKVILVFPTTYMNLSGEAIVEIMNFYKLALDEIIVIVDDIDIPFETVRYREKGGAGTHNGMRNIVELLGSEDFKRIRIGIENKDNLNIETIDYVLSRFTKTELKTLETKVFKEVEENILNFLTK